MPKKEYPKRLTPIDGPRYVVSTESKTTKGLYNYKQELDHQKAAIETADAWAEREKTSVMVFDRIVGFVIYEKKL